jgi:hypothetical protein
LDNGDRSSIKLPREPQIEVGRVDQHGADCAVVRGCSLQAFHRASYPRQPGQNLGEPHGGKLTRRDYTFGAGSFESWTRGTKETDARLHLACRVNQLRTDGVARRLASDD